MQVCAACISVIWFDVSKNRTPIRHNMSRYTCTAKRCWQLNASKDSLWFTRWDAQYHISWTHAGWSSTNTYNREMLKRSVLAHDCTANMGNCTSHKRIKKHKLWKGRGMLVAVSLIGNCQHSSCTLTGLEKGELRLERHPSIDYAVAWRRNWPTSRRMTRRAQLKQLRSEG